MRIYDQQISNWPSSTWLVELRRIEGEDGEVVTHVYPKPTSAVPAPPALVARLGWSARTDADSPGDADESLAVV